MSEPDVEEGFYVADFQCDNGVWKNGIIVEVRRVYESLMVFYKPDRPYLLEWLLESGRLKLKGRVTDEC